MNPDRDAPDDADEQYGFCEGCNEGRTAYYLVRDRANGVQVQLCGPCLATVNGDKK
jgi:hypothetical protein